MRTNLIGKKFGYLEVIGQEEKRYRNYRVWICKCICGKIVTRISTRLHKTMPSCGCKFDHKSWPKLDPQEASYRGLYRRYKENSKMGGRKLLLSLEIFKDLTKKNCFYCKEPPSQIYNVFITKSGTTTSTIEGTRNQAYIHFNGIDRVDSNADYILENCVPCCVTCNRAKREMPVEEFKDWLKRISKKWCEVSHEV